MTISLIKEYFFIRNAKVERELRCLLVVSASTTGRIDVVLTNVMWEVGTSLQTTRRTPLISGPRPLG